MCVLTYILLEPNNNLAASFQHYLYIGELGVSVGCETT